MFPELTSGARVGVPTDGVIAFRASAYGELAEALALMTIEVTHDGEPVAGAIETIEISSIDDWGSPLTNLFVVWRPEATFAPSSDYVASIAVLDEWDLEGRPHVTTLDIATAAGPAGALPAPQLSELTLAAESAGTGPKVCCDDGNSCGFPACAAPDAADHPRLRVTLQTGDEALAAQAYVRLLAGVDDALEPYTIAGIAADIDGNTFQRSFDAAAGSYCVGAELVSFIDGSALPIVSACEAHGDLELTSGPNPAFASFLEQCVGDPYWQDTREPYEPDDGDTDGDDTGDDSGDADAGDADAGDADAGDDADGGNDGDGTGGNSGGGQDDDSKGCACTVDSDRSAWPALSGLLILGVALGRRRRRR